MTDTVAIVLGLAAIAALIYVLIVRPIVQKDPWAHVQPEMRPGPKRWMLGNKANGTGKPLDYLPSKGGEYCCPDCGKGPILAGPSGGLAQNIACDSCLAEFNIGLFDSPPVVIERRGRMTVQRAAIYGISPEEYEGKAK